MSDLDTKDHLNSEEDFIGKVRFELTIDICCLFGFLLLFWGGEVGINQICTKKIITCAKTHYYKNKT